jgi:hypothetical protein
MYLVRSLELEQLSAADKLRRSLIATLYITVRAG